HHTRRDGLHMAALASAWTAIVSGFGGLRDHGGVLSFDPALPAGIDRLSFAVRWQGRSLRVTVTSTQATYALHDDDPRPLTLVHAGAGLEVTNDRPRTVALLKRVAALPTPEQPPGRRPGDGQ
ncbi:glycosyl hydrolase family 65 protein, partial [Actinoplanes sp. NPDC048791]|uniref:glycosyl hydrolase family 65 protein n=1 Tax=Actinoplanes sp. NPDC048791 TaxID=3154623 RepID=UPI0033DD20A4